MDRMAVNRLKSVNDFDSLLTYLRDELDWPVDDHGFDDLTFQYTATELGLDEQSAAKVTEIRRLRPLDDEQPWGIFFLELEPKRLPVVSLRRVLSKMTLKKRASSNRSDSPAWHADDILFISRTGESDERHLTFAHFAINLEKADLPVLKVLGWDASDTVLRVDHVAEVLKEKLVWPEDPSDSDQWRKQWRDAFTLKHREQVTTAKEMASRLAELARGIRGAIREVLAVESENGPLTKIMDAFRESLVHDLDPEQFADTYAQTITYGLLSARITDPSRNTLDDLASHMQTNPFLKELMESFIHVGGREKNDSGVGLDFDELGVSDVIELLDNANMEAVVRDFGKYNQQEDPVIHFFEGFLQEYDKSIRKDRGVFYTPRPVVSFIVRSVDELLRTEFGLEDGLADTTTWGEMAGRIDDLEIPEGATAEQAFVQILDPATGTGTFLVEVIDLIHRTMIAKWQFEGHSNKKVEALWNAYVPEHLLPRLYGYELMMAPYAIAHMKIGLKLYETGYRFESDERARVYLTNALEPVQDLSGTLDFAIEALAHEAEAVNGIKRDQRFTVVIGNPPYSKISSNLTPEMRATVERYRYLDGQKIKERGALQFEINLQDDYVKFFRLCETNIIASGKGVLGLITNNGYLSTPTLRGMRDSLLETFSSIKVLDLHGHIAKGEIGPDGAKEENVFDIVQGVALFFGVRSALRENASLVQHAEQYGTRQSKYDFLQSQSYQTSDSAVIEPRRPFYLFIPQNLDLAAEWQAFVGLPELFIDNSAGIITARDSLVLDHDREALATRMEAFSDAGGPDESIYSEYGFSESKRFNLREAQTELRKLESFIKPIRKLLHRPFDDRFIFFHRSVIWSMSRPMANQMFNEKNLALLATRQVTRPQYEHAFVSRKMIEIKACSHDRNTQIFPLFSSSAEDGLPLYSSDTSNLNKALMRRLSGMLNLTLNTETIERGTERELTPLRVFHYLYAVLYSQSYRDRYFEFLRSDFPRIPLIRNLRLFSSLSVLGEELASQHLLESPQLDQQVSIPIGEGDFEVEKVSYSDNSVWIDKAKTRGFGGVSPAVWNFYIGGYRVCEKWLKDRGPKKGKSGLLLTDKDIEHYQKIIVSLSETIRIMTEIDEVIEAQGGWPHAFQMDDTSVLAANGGVDDEADEVIAELTMVVEPRDG